ncbi:hypothetical protein MXD81_33680 [Microbacteriaceae bacterium K1510]|nr:hypothetical protein [Microbacteriaceae bacterium K1510]
MNRITVAAIFGLVAAVPAGAAGVYFHTPSTTTPCFAAPTGAYRIADEAADYTVRIDDAAANPSLRLQVVDDPAIADFVLVDDDAPACPSGARLKSVRIDPEAAAPDLTVALSRAPGDKKIYVNSARFSEQQAAALFAVAWGARAVTAHAAAR